MYAHLSSDHKILDSLINKESYKRGYGNFIYIVSVAHKKLDDAYFSIRRFTTEYSVDYILWSSVIIEPITGFLKKIFEGH